MQDQAFYERRAARDKYLDEMSNRAMELIRKNEEIIREHRGGIIEYEDCKEI